MSAPAPSNTSQRLPARVFYGVILAGVLLGAIASGAGAALYLDAGDREPTGRRIWGDVAKGFVVPIAVMMGSTFGGLWGFFAAAIWDKRRVARLAGAHPEQGFRPATSVKTEQAGS